MKKPISLPLQDHADNVVVRFCLRGVAYALGVAALVCLTVFMTGCSLESGSYRFCIEDQQNGSVSTEADESTDPSADSSQEYDAL